MDLYLHVLYLYGIKYLVGPLEDLEDLVSIVDREDMITTFVQRFNHLLRNLRFQTLRRLNQMEFNKPQVMDNQGMTAFPFSFSIVKPLPFWTRDVTLQ